MLDPSSIKKRERAHTLDRTPRIIACSNSEARTKVRAFVFLPVEYFAESLASV